MLERFREHLNASKILPNDGLILVGYSGGADSACLVHLLYSCGIDQVAAHLHHGQRGEADDEMARCEAFCDGLGVPFASGRADVPKMAAELKIGLEEAGRNARKEFLAQAAVRLGCQAIATAHTRDDHVETVLLKLARGAGLRGLRGITERNGGFVRPLLPFLRVDTRAYCEERGLWFHDDPANTDLAFSRARVRARIMPELRQINGSADLAIVRMAQLAGEEDEFLDGMAAAALERAEIALNGELSFLTRECEFAFDRQLLMHLPPVLFRRALRLASSTLGGELDFTQSRLLAEGARNQEKGAITAEGGEIVVEWNMGEIHVRRLESILPFRSNLTIPGETISDDLGWCLTAYEARPQGEPLRASLEIDLDMGKGSGPYHFRNAKPGDDIQPLGFHGRRKVADVMSESGLTLNARKRLPVVCDMIGPVWVPGVCLEERVRPTANTQKGLHIKFGPALANGTATETAQMS